MKEDRGSNGPIGPGRPSIANSSRRTDAPLISSVGETRKAVEPGVPHSRWPQYVQYLVVVGVTALFLLLAASMQRHHFFNGENDKFESADRTADR
jgi:hypothetical protein